ncbi:MAG TPA: hypothetical protein VK249_27845 [Anaerolineales bacterium]|nr:hypothetical protein [Anaerolineales bacterium]
MNKLDIPPALLKYQTGAQSVIPALQTVNNPPKLAGRLITLIPADSDYALGMKQIWKLATTTGMPIQLISLCKDLSQEPSVRRGLVTMSALIRDGRVCAEAKVEIGTNWVDVVKHNYQSGDTIVCFAEQRAGLLHRPLSQILQADLNMPVYILSGLIPQNPTRSNWLPQIMMWLGSLGIIVGSSLLQIRITSLSQDWAQTTLLILSVIGEAWLIWVWNSLFS